MFRNQDQWITYHSTSDTTHQTDQTVASDLISKAMAIATITVLPIAFSSRHFTFWRCGSIRKNPPPSSFSESKRGLRLETSGNCRREQRAVIVFFSQQSDSQTEQKTVQSNGSLLNKVIISL